MTALHELAAGHAVIFHEHCRAAGAARGPGDRLVVRQVHPLHPGVQALPGLVIGPLISEQFLHAARFDLHLQLGVASPFLFGTRLDAQGRQRVQVGRIDAQWTVHQFAIARPLRFAIRVTQEDSPGQPYIPLEEPHVRRQSSTLKASVDEGERSLSSH